jgi:hypothetical protein
MQSSRNRVGARAARILNTFARERRAQETLSGIVASNTLGEVQAA